MQLVVQYECRQAPGKGKPRRLAFWQLVTTSLEVLRHTQDVKETNTMITGDNVTKLLREAPPNCKLYMAIRGISLPPMPVLM